MHCMMGMPVRVRAHMSVHVHGGVWGGLPSVRCSNLPLPPTCPSPVWSLPRCLVAQWTLTWILLISWAMGS